MSRVYTKMTDLIGRTPLLELTRVEEAEELKASLRVKLESFNPAGSAKDRIAKAMIEDAEARGLLGPGSVIIEATSGNTGIGLAAVAAARAAVVGGFKGTANLLAAQMYGLKAIGTAAHCFTLVHDDERSAFESQIAALGKNTTLLVDTYNIEEAVKTAVDVAGPELGGVRIDSGDLASLAQRVRNQLDALGATNTKITVTNDLDEYALASLQTAPVDSYGVGTMLVTGSGAPTCAMVYKLTERENSAGEMQPVAKKSKDKATVPGRKLAFRSYEYSLADCEHVISGSEDKLAAYQPEDGWKDLLVDYVTNGENHSEYQGHDAIVNAHNYRAQALAELPIGAQSLMKGDPVIPTEVTVL